MKEIRCQRGLSLLEMMISLAIGVLLLLGLGSIYQVANQSSKDNETLVSNAEVANQVFNRLGYDLKRAGFVDLYDSPTRSFFYIDKNGTKVFYSGIDCPESFQIEAPNERYGLAIGDNTSTDMNAIYMRLKDKDATIPMNSAFLTPIGAISCGTMRPVFACEGSIAGYPNVFSRAVCADSGSENSLEVTYQAVRKSSSGLSALPTEAEDCGYNPIEDSRNGLSDNNGFVINRYFVEETAFKCQSNYLKKGSDNIPQRVTLVEGVQEMVLRYVTTVPESDATNTLSNSDSGKVVTGYKTASEIAATELGWSGVVGVEVCLVVSTPAISGMKNSSLARLQGDSRPSCVRDGDEKLTTVAKEDNSQFYQRYIRTFSLPNALYSPIQQ